MNTNLSRGAALLAGLLVLGCSSSDGPSGPVAGPLNIVLTSPNTDDGAVMFQVTGVIDSAVTPAGVTLYQSIPGPNVVRGVATGSNLHSGSTLMTVYVADVAKASDLSLTVLQVAAKVTYAQRPVGGYSLTAEK